MPRKSQTKGATRGLTKTNAKLAQRKRGRPPGSPNKRTVAMLEILEKKNFDPVAKAIYIHDEAIKSFEADTGDFAFKYLEIAARLVMELMKYVYPQRKSVEVDLGESAKETLTALVKSLEDKAANAIEVGKVK